MANDSTDHQSEAPTTPASSDTPPSAGQPAEQHEASQSGYIDPYAGYGVYHYLNKDDYVVYDDREKEDYFLYEEPYVMSSTVNRAMSARANFEAYGMYLDLGNLIDMIERANAIVRGQIENQQLRETILEGDDESSEGSDCDSDEDHEEDKFNFEDSESEPDDDDW